jgi:hypothetical protein
VQLDPPGTQYEHYEYDEPADSSSKPARTGGQPVPGGDVDGDTGDGYDDFSPLVRRRAVGH